MSPTVRRNALAVGVVAMLALLVAQRQGWLAALGAGPSGSSAAAQGDALRSEASLLARQRSLVEAAPMWESAEAEALRAWHSSRESVVLADTRALAEAQLRDRLLSELGAAGTRSPQAVAVPRPEPSSPAPSAPSSTPAASVEVLRFRVSFDAPEHPIAIDALQRIESMSAPRLRIESLTIAGPADRQAARGVLAVSLEVEAVAVIGRTRGGPLAVMTGHTTGHDAEPAPVVSSSGNGGARG